MDSLRRLEEIFARFPGIGPRQAKRFVYHLLNKSPAGIKEFVDLVQDVKSSTSECESCHRFFIGRSSRCSICSDPDRDRSLLMIVARDPDFETVEKSGAYRGLYFILGGTVPILDKEPEKKIRLQQLIMRVKTDKPAEVILSLSATPDGENTAETVRKHLSGTKISLLGRGLSTGAELEYVDSDTVKSALENRHLLLNKPGRL